MISSSFGSIDTNKRVFVWPIGTLSWHSSRQAHRFTIVQSRWVKKTTAHIVIFSKKAFLYSCQKSLIKVSVVLFQLELLRLRWAVLIGGSQWWQIMWLLTVIQRALEHLGNRGDPGLDYAHWTRIFGYPNGKTLRLIRMTSWWNSLEIDTMNADCTGWWL